MQVEDPTEMGTKPERRRALRMGLMVMALFMCGLVTQELLNPSNPNAPLLPSSAPDSATVRPADSLAQRPLRRPEPIMLDNQ